MLLYGADLPLSRPTLGYVAGVIRRHRKKTRSRWRKLKPREQAYRNTAAASARARAPPVW